MSTKPVRDLEAEALRRDGLNAAEIAAVRTNETVEELRNEDPLSGEAGAHPVGTGVGAALGGAATGAIAGTVAGPIGAVIGAAVGAVVGGLGGKAVAESIDPTVELAYWEKNLVGRSYYDPAYNFSDYEPAYRLASERYDAARRFEDIEAGLERDWESVKAHSRLTWLQAREAMYDAWQRMTGQCDSNGSCATKPKR